MDIYVYLVVESMCSLLRVHELGCAMLSGSQFITSTTIYP